MRFESLLQFIVPLAFLAIWALTSLFNREAQPLPPRTGRAPGSGGPRPTPGGQAARPATERRPTLQTGESFVRRSEPDRRPSQRSTRSPDDGIVILESETKRPGSSSQRIGAPSLRKGARGRSGSAQTAKRAEPTTPRMLASSMTSQASIASEVAQPRSLNPLVLPHSPLLSTNTAEPPKAISVADAAARATLTSGDLRMLIGSPQRLRESFLMNEILQPPVALRRGGLRRR
jgi:hypothetical protein